MRRTLAQIHFILEPAERRRALLLVCLCVPLAVAELLGLLGAVPFVMVAADPIAAQSNWMISGISTLLGDISDSRFLLWLGGASLGLMLISVGFRTIHIYLITRFARDVGVSLQTRLLAGYLDQSQTLIRRGHSSDVQSAVIVESEEVVDKMVLNMLRGATYLSTAAFVIGLLVFTDPVAGLAMLFLIGTGYVTIFSLSRRKLRGLGKGRVQLARERQRLLQEAVGGQRELQLAQREDATVKRFRDTATNLGQVHARMTFFKEIPRGFLEILIFGSMIMLALWLIYARADRGAAVLPVIAIYALAGARLFPVLQRLYKAIAEIQASGPGLANVSQKLAETQQAETPATDSPIALTRDISLDAVNFSYAGSERLALNNVSLRIKARSIVGFVGETGAGKSTAVDILLGLASPDMGQVRVDDRAVLPENRRNWQRSVGYVPQEIFLTDGTIAQNIAFGLSASEIDPAALDRVIQSAGLSSFINRQPHGVDTEIGERGVRLSGGERQRIGIARGLYHNPDLIVFDEATSALDTVTERAVMREIKALGEDKTILLVAHRLSTVRHCDQIFLFQDGKIAASGTYDELLGQNAQFRALHEATQ